MFQKAKATEVLEIFGSRQFMLQFLYVEDVVAAFVKVIQNGRLRGVYNLSSLEKMSLGDLAVVIKDLCKSTSEIRFNNEDKVIFSEVKSHKVEADLGWKATTSIKQILLGYCS